MITFFKKLFKNEQEVPTKKQKKKKRYYQDDVAWMNDEQELIENSLKMSFQKEVKEFTSASNSKIRIAMDANPATKFNAPWGTTVPASVLNWYASQGFIGYQMCATIAQHWLVSKACAMPAQDAARNGYEITVNNGEEVDAEILDAIRKADEEFSIKENTVEFVQMGRIFGIRIAMFKIESTDDDFYELPFNIDGVTTDSYKGISQIDPYWIIPELDAAAAGDPSSINFYEPTWWRVNGKRIHRTHLIIFKTEEVTDILKPTYIYGGIPIPQKIYERVYSAERTANEAPMLAMTKRTDVIKTDTARATGKQQNFMSSILKFIFNRDNYGVKVIGLGDEMQQFDTSLTDLDSVIMTQFQLVAAQAEVPAVKLLGTPPKGFNATGEYEESSYHEFLEGVQKFTMSRLINRHHLLLIKSRIAPKFGLDDLKVSIVWNPLDAITAKEQAEINKMEAETGSVLVNSGAIDGYDERQRIINSPTSGYNGLIDEEIQENNLINEIPDEINEEN